MEASLLTILKGVPFLLKFFFKEDYQATGVVKSQSFVVLFVKFCLLALTKIVGQLRKLLKFWVYATLGPMAMTCLAGHPTFENVPTPMLF